MLLDNSLHEKAAALFYEGEPYIPDEFLSGLSDSFGEKTTNLSFYYEKHIEGLKKPGYSSTGRMIELLCENYNERFDQAENVAEIVMKNRISLWSQLVELFESEYQNDTSFKSSVLKLVYSA